MKVVLKEDVKTIGKKGEMHEVSDGYARNYLLPRGLAKSADAAAINEVKNKEAASEFHLAQQISDAKAQAALIDGKTVVIKAKAGQGGRLFGAITTKDIAQAIETSIGTVVDKRKIVLAKEIKNYGKYDVDIKVYSKVTAKLTVTVEE